MGYAGSDEEPQLETLSLPAPFEVSLDSDPRLWAWRKAADVIRTNAQHLGPETVVLGADTVVVSPNRLLGKPKDEQDAIEMLLLLKGVEHYVVTGFALLMPPSHPGGHIRTLHVEAVVSPVLMKDYSLSDLEGYVATGEPMDKAGAYAVQGLGGNLVQRVESCRTNVVGLPLCRVRKALQHVAVSLTRYPPEGYCEFCPTSAQMSDEQARL
jgi:septum formation protein